MPGVFDNPAVFEPTFTFMGFLNRVNDVRPPFAVEGRVCVAVTHLALLGVKRRETALWVFYFRYHYSFQYDCVLDESICRLQVLYLFKFIMNNFDLSEQIIDKILKNGRKNHVFLV